jgi:hypothetical protein
MGRVIRAYCFWYGCLGAIACFVWYLFAVFGRAALPNSVWVAEAIFGTYALAMLFTFQRNVRQRPKPPMFTVTPARIKLGKALLGVAIANFNLCLAVLVFAAIRADLPLENWVMPLILTSFLLLSTIYIALHWAFRPESFLSRRVIRVFTNPLSLGRDPR